MKESLKQNNPTKSYEEHLQSADLAYKALTEGMLNDEYIELYKQQHPEDLERINAFLNNEVTLESVQEEINQDLNRIETKINKIGDISHELELVKQNDGDPSIVEKQLKPQLSVLQKIRENVSGRFAKAAAMVSMIGALNLAKGQENKTQSFKRTETSVQESQLPPFEDIVNDHNYFLEHATEYVDSVGQEKIISEIMNVVHKDPKLFLRNAYRFANLASSDFDLGKVITDAVNTYDAYGVKIDPRGYKSSKIDLSNTPDIFAEHLNDFKSIPGLDLSKIIPMVFRDNEDAVLNHIRDFENIPGFDLVKFVSDNGIGYHNAFIKNISEINQVQGLAVAPILNNIAQAYPGDLLMSADEESLRTMTTIPGFDLQQLLLDEPVVAYASGAIEKLKGTDAIKTPELQKFDALLKNDFNDTEKNEALLTLMNDIVRHDLPIEDAKKIASDPILLFKSLVKIRSEKGHLGARSVEEALWNLALQRVQKINSLHNELDNVRFKSIENFSPEELYLLMTYGENEIFTSSFNGLFSRMMAGMKKEGLAGDKLLERVNNEKSRVFVRECAGFNRFNEFLETMDDSAQEKTIVDLVSGIKEQEDFLTEGATMVDIMSSLKNDKKLYSKVEEQIKLNIVQQEGSMEQQLTYIVLAAVAASYDKDTTVWPVKFQELLELSTFDLERLSTPDLFNEKGINVQEYFFYNDKDGKGSFTSFLAQYENKPGWEVKKHADFVEIQSTGKGKKIQIFANYPESDESGSEKIQEMLEKLKLSPTVIVHRGHSYHADATINDIQSTAKIVSLGSCGGYNSVSEVLKKSPGAHILSTKGTGTMLVNDPLLKMLNEQILSGKDIVWSDFWEKLEKKVGNDPRFKDYVAPDKNAGALFVKMYYDAMDKLESLGTAEEQK